MTRSDLMRLLRHHLSDEQNVGWQSETELFAFLDRAADFVSDTLISMRDPRLISRVMITGTAVGLPPGFVKFVGKVPVAIKGNLLEPYPGIGGEFAYWARVPHPSSFGPDDTLPYDRDIALVIADVARLFAQNKNEFDISQDLSLLNLGVAATKGAR